MRARELIRILEKNGWYRVSQNGSHLKMKNGIHTEIIPIHSKDIPIGTVKEILKRTGLKNKINK